MRHVILLGYNRALSSLLGHVSDLRSVKAESRIKLLLKVGFPYLRDISHWRLTSSSDFHRTTNELHPLHIENFATIKLSVNSLLIGDSFSRNYWRRTSVLSH